MFIAVRQDAWSKSRCILYPVSSAVVQAVTSKDSVPYMREDDAQELLISAIASVLAAVTHNGVSFITLVLTEVHNSMVLLCGSNLSESCGTLYPWPPLVVAQSGTHAVIDLNCRNSSNMADMFQRAVWFCFQATEMMPVTCYAAYCSDPFTAAVCMDMPPLHPPGVVIQTVGNVDVCVRSATAVPHVVPVLDSSGAVLYGRRANLSALFSHLYLRVLPTVTMAEVDNVLRMFGTVGVPHSLAPTLTNKPMRTQLVGAETVMSCFSPPTVFFELVDALRAFTGPSSISEVLTQYTRPTTQLPLSVKGVMLAKARALVHLRYQEQEDAKAVIREALESPLTVLPVCDGIVFDLLLHNLSMDGVPTYFHPLHFLNDAEGVGFFTMLYLLQWRNTLTCLVQVAHTRLDELGRGVVETLRTLQTFRTGLLVQPPVETMVRSVHRMVDDTHGFFINLGNREMFELGSRNCLQQQRAEDRNVVVAYFFGEALKLLSPLLQPEDSAHVAAVLTEGYMASLKPKCATNLTKVYERTQFMVRRIRQEVTSVRQAEGGGERHKRRA